jgi:hypothetical protein
MTLTKTQQALIDRAARHGGSAAVDCGSYPPSGSRTMIRFCLGLMLAMGAVEAPHDAPLAHIIAQAIVGLTIAGLGARKIANPEN